MQDRGSAKKGCEECVWQNECVKTTSPFNVKACHYTTDSVLGFMDH